MLLHEELVMYCVELLILENKIMAVSFFYYQNNNCKETEILTDVSFFKTFSSLPLCVLKISLKKKRKKKKLRF